MYHLLIKRVSTIMSGFVLYRVRVRVELNQVGIEWAVECIGLFIALDTRVALLYYYFF
jgi:hypothetical protein